MPFPSRESAHGRLPGAIRSWLHGQTRARASRHRLSSQRRPPVPSRTRMAYAQAGSGVVRDRRTPPASQSANHSDLREGGLGLARVVSSLLAGRGSMIHWRKKVEEYVELRRSLGFKLLDAKNGLIQFASFLEQSRATHITIPVAMKSAQKNKSARPAECAKRLSFVRGFARHWSAHDSRTEVPPSGLLPYRPGRES